MPPEPGRLGNTIGCSGGDSAKVYVVWSCGRAFPERYAEAIAAWAGGRKLSFGPLFLDPNSAINLNTSRPFSIWDPSRPVGRPPAWGQDPVLDHSDCSFALVRLAGQSPSL